MPEWLNITVQGSATAAPAHHAIREKEKERRTAFVMMPSDFLLYLNIVVGLCLTVGGFFAFRNGRQTQLTRMQKDTIEVMQQRIDTLESKIGDVEKENVVQRHIIETITSALKQRGMAVTIDGDMVTISDKSGSSTHRKRTITTQQSATITKKEEE
jgi:hypothetical protein